MARIVELLALVVASYGVTWVAIRLAEKFGIRDVPNSRSSHQRPVPRGGGIAIVLTFALGLSTWPRGLPGTLLWAIVAPGILVAAVGYVDDIRHLSAKARLLVHLAASLAAAYWIAAANQRASAPPSGLWLGATALGIAWLINLTNFMDGIDGILGAQALAVSLAAAVLCWAANDAMLAQLYLVLAACTLGFLVWNWSPARIFMGDVGSGFIGFVYGALTLLAWLRGTLRLETSLILFGVFIGDATYTLIVRAALRCDVTAAHRDHAYQKAVQSGLPHAKVSLAVAAIDCLWLAPWAYLSTRIDPVVCLLAAYLPLIAVAVHYRAGVPPSRMLAGTRKHA